VALTEDQKFVYLEEIRKYKILKKETNLKKSVHLKAISDLEKELKDSIPITPDGIDLCKNCGIISMAYVKRPIRTVLGNYKEEAYYQCEVCGKKEYF
jgi:DNA-directed RNA polymerase subunit M/transcription elongation factor TFIIS